MSSTRRPFSVGYAAPPQEPRSPYVSSSVTTPSSPTSGLETVSRAGSSQLTGHSGNPKRRSLYAALEENMLAKQTASISLARQFLEDVLGEPLSHQSLYHSLRDGVLLCLAVNIMSPGLIKQISRRNVPFLQMENISNFLIAARSLGVPDAYLFSTVDLYEDKNIPQVATTLLALARAVYQYQPSLSRHQDEEDLSTPHPEFSESQRSRLRDKIHRDRALRTIGSNLSVSDAGMMEQRSLELKALHQEEVKRALSRKVTPSFPIPELSRPNRGKGRRKDHEKNGSASRISCESRDVLHITHEQSDQVSRYQLGESIGKGQYGTVYRAFNMETGEVVAVKRMIIDTQEEEEMDSLMKEVDLLRHLSHPNIVRYEGFHKNHNHLSIILEYMENGSLLHTLRSYGVFSEKLVATYVVKILDGLIYLHDREVVHCDLKAANLLTTKDGNVKLSDFGVSLNLKLTADIGAMVAGTPNWMAPEVIELKGASTASDIWSLGCTVIELITGHPPYDGLLAMTTLFRIVEDDCPPLPEDVSPDMLDFLKLCFNKEPRERPTARDLLSHSLVRDVHLSRRHADSLPSSFTKESYNLTTPIPEVSVLVADEHGGSEVLVTGISVPPQPPTSCPPLDPLTLTLSTPLLVEPTPGFHGTKDISLAPTHHQGDSMGDSSGSADTSGEGGGEGTSLFHTQSSSAIPIPGEVGNNPYLHDGRTTNATTSLNSSTPSFLLPSQASLATSVSDSVTPLPRAQIHDFVSSIFGRSVQCKLCREIIRARKKARICSECGLVSHKSCSKDKSLLSLRRCGTATIVPSGNPHNSRLAESTDSFPHDPRISPYLDQQGTSISTMNGAFHGLSPGSRRPHGQNRRDRRFSRAFTANDCTIL